MKSFALFFLLLLAGLFTQAQTEVWVHGKLLTDDNEPVIGARLVFENSDGSYSETTSTGLDGDFSFYGVPVAVEELSEVSGISVVPNPGMRQVLRYPKPENSDGMAQIYSLNGMLVKNIPVSDNGSEVELVLGENLPQGVYIFSDGGFKAKVFHRESGEIFKKTGNKKSGGTRDLYTFNFSFIEGNSNVLFEEVTFEENISQENSYFIYHIEALGYMHVISGTGNVAGAQLTFENDEHTITAVTNQNGYYSTGEVYLNNPEETFDVTVEAEGYQTLEETIVAYWYGGGGDNYSFTLEEEYPDYYENEEVWHRVFRQDYPYTGTETTILNAKVKFEGINIDYADSTSINGDYNVIFNNLRVPVNDEGEPGVAQYRRTTTPVDTTYTQMFMKEVDTVEVTMDSWQLPDAEPLQYPQNVRMTGSVEDLITEESLEGKHVIARDPTSGDVIAEAVTQADGSYWLNNRIEAGTTFEWAVGHYNGEDSDHLSTQGHTYTIADQIVGPNDTVVNAGFSLITKNVTPPATPNDPNYGVSYPVDIEILQQMDGDMPGHLGYDGEHAFGRQVRFHYGDLTGGDVQDFKDFIIYGDSLFHGYSTTVPIDNPNRPHKLIDQYFNSDNIPMDYNPITNPQTESIGWNIQYGGNETWDINREFESYLPYTTTAVAGGDIEVSLSWSIPEATLKELYGRANGFGSVSAGDSFMNPISTHPTIQDRICYKLIEASDKRIMETYDNENQTITFPATVGLQEYIDSDKK